MIIQSNRIVGFTLLEMLAVLSIMTLLVALAFPVYQDYSDRARSSEIIARYDELRTNVATSLINGEVENCADLAGTLNDPNLGEDYADLSLAFEATGSAGYRPVLSVCARNDDQGAAAVRVAHAALDELSTQHRVESGAVVSDAIISFTLPLTLDDQPVCRVPVTGTTSSCGGGSQPAPSQPAPSQPAAQPPAVAVTNPPVVQPANPQPPEVLNALGAVPAAQQQAVADMINQLDQNQGMLDSLGSALEGGGPLGTPGPDFAAASQQCGISPFAKGEDTYLGDCGTDFPGMCLRDTNDPDTSCLVIQICQVSCGVIAPASPEVAAAMKEKHYQSVRSLCYGSTISNTFQPDNQYCQELTRLDAARASGN